MFHRNIKVPKTHLEGGSSKSHCAQSLMFANHVRHGAQLPAHLGPHSTMLAPLHEGREPELG